MDISARAISLADRPQWTIWVTSVRTRPEDRSSISFCPLADLGRLKGSRVESSRGLNLARLERSTMRKDAPSNAGELVGERDGENVVMQPLLGRLEPWFEALALPALGLDQHNPRRLHEQDPQVAIAAFRYLAEDGAVASRDLLGDEPQPGGEVAAFRERVTSAYRSYHRAGDDRPNPRHAHQAFTAGIPACKNLDLTR